MITKFSGKLFQRTDVILNCKVITQISLSGVFDNNI